jgi:hypothetical protein
MLNLQPLLRPVKAADESPIFIIGTGRSGTTLLRQMLTAHPRIHITHEAGFYSYANHAPPGMTAAEWLELYFQTFSFAWLRLPPQVVRDALPPGWSRLTVPEVIGQVAGAVMRGKAQQQGKLRFGDKNPLDTHNLGRIFADFPDARVVYITRDPRPTALSFMRMPFGTSSALINSWICRLSLSHVQPYLDRILEVRLEDLVSEPRAVLESILNFVGEPWDEAVLAHLQHAATDDVPPLPWFVGATRELPSREQSAGSWQKGLTPAWIRLIENINRRSMERYGYAPARLVREPRFWHLWAALLRDVPGLCSAAYRLLSLKRKLDRHFQDKQRLDPQQGMEENLRLNPAAWQHYPEFSMPPVPALVAAHRDSI